MKVMIRFKKNKYRKIMMRILKFEKKKKKLYFNNNIFYFYFKYLLFNIKFI